MAMYEVSSGETHCMTVLDEGVEYVNNQDDMGLIYASAVNTINFRYSKTASVSELLA
jgi:hypothetical protein